MLKKITILIFVFSIFVIPSVLFAQQTQITKDSESFLLVQAGRSTNWGLDTVAQNTGLTKEGSSLSFPRFLGSLINPLLAVLGSVFLVLIIYAGIMWMTAQGNDEKVARAKKIINTSVVGLLLVTFAYVIARFLVSNVFNAMDEEPIEQQQKEN